MSYQVLARKYRPKNFDTLVGQEHVVRALTHALDSRRLHHAYLFTGTRGVGKTTLSRILAKSFNCLGADGTGDITASPCGVCEACVAIDSGRFVDYIEMDAASNRGVDEMAQLLEQAVYAPSNARFKVYMIDEVHMLTNTAFNSMLKTLEEPPEHVKFILATTDPQKIPVTVLSRCLQFNLKQMPPGHIISHLENILGQEQIVFELPALRLLAQGAHGSMRDALSLTDQAIAYAAGSVTLDAVQGMLGALDQSFLIRIMDALAQEDGAALLALTDEMSTRSLSFHTALQDLATLMHRLAMAQTVPTGLPADWPEREEILRLAKLFDAEEVQLFYQILLHGKQELGLAPDEYAGFSMTLLRMLAFRPTALGQQVAALPAAQAPRATAPAARGAASPAPVANAVAAPAAANRSAPVAVPPANPGAAGERMTPGRAALLAARGGTPPAATVSATVASAAAVTPVATSVATPVAAAQPAAVANAAAPAAEPPAVRVAEPPDNDMPPWVTADDEGDFGVAQKKTEFDAQSVELEPEGRRGISRAQQDAADAALRVATGIAAKAAARAAAGPQPQSQQDTPAQLDAKPLRATRETQPTPPFTLHPVANWDGDWPALTAQLPLRGVVQQLAWQTELQAASQDGACIDLHVRCELETLCSPQNLEKLVAALSEFFGLTARVKAEIGAVWHTAHQRAEAARAQRQREAEQAIRDDPFVKSMMREFGASVVPDSVKPVLEAALAA
jgi:DNA polymerase-3 subunit gamma/tau